MEHDVSRLEVPVDDFLSNQGVVPLEDCFDDLDRFLFC